MGLNFSLFNIGQSALRANQLGLAVTGQNISNVNTAGYTRQGVELSATPAQGAGPQTVGTGVTIHQVRAFRDQFIESRLLTETGIAGRLTAQRDALAPVEASFDESGGGGISQALQNFFGGFRDLEANPASLPLRTVALANGTELATALSTTSNRLEGIRSDTDQLLRTTVGTANQLSLQVAEINGKIRLAQHTGAATSELIDQRTEAVKALGELTGIRQSDNSDGTINLSLGDGSPLVASDRAFPLKTVSQPPHGLAAIQLNDEPAVLSTGRLKGLQTALETVSSHLTALDDLAASIAQRVNSTHATGVDLSGVPGGPFFVAPNGGPITAANLAVSPALKSDPKKLAAGAPGGGSGDAAIARQIAGLLTDPNSTVGSRTGSFGDIFASQVADAGQSVKSAADALSTQQVILSQTIEQRNAASGVSLDEEAVNLLRYQRAFESAAKFLKVADEVTQTILELGR